jgi:hypothetical protein
MDKTHYDTKGWVHLKNVIPNHMIETLYPLAVYLKKGKNRFSRYRLIPCAGQFSRELSKLYTSELMLEMSSKFLGDDVYLFNDQIVMKNPMEEFVFEEHYDNQYITGIDPNIHTVNICWILDDFTDENGTLEVQNKDDNQWIKLYPKRGDAVVINGYTYHRSGKNNSNKARGLYACVYADALVNDIGRYNEKFIGTKEILEVWK